MLSRIELRQMVVFLILLTLVACSSPFSDNGAKRYSMKNDSATLEPINPATIRKVVPKVEVRTAAGNKNPYTVNGQTYYLLESEAGYVETGMASWYGRKFHGHLTANGEVYDMFQLSAAHKSLPIPSYLNVTNLDNGKSIVVRVNDRGPFYKGRIVDLSYAAAAMLDFAHNGTAKVRVESIVPGAKMNQVNSAITTSGNSPSLPGREGLNVPINASIYTEKSQLNEVIPSRSSENMPEYLQVGAFSNLNAAQALLTRLGEISSVPAFIRSEQSQAGSGLLHRVRLGPVNETMNVEYLIELIEGAGLGRAFRVKP